MSEAMLMVAKGYEMIAAGFRKMAEGGAEMPELPVPAKKEEVKDTPAKPEIKITEDDLRKILAEKSRSGKTQEVKMLLKECGADKLSAVPEEKYPELLKKAEAL